MPAIPSTEPDVIVAGDTVEWTKSITDYPATDGWTLKYAFQLAGSPETPITFNASTSGAGYSVSKSATTTAAWTPGNYILTGYVDNGTARHRVVTGAVTILPNPTAAFGATHATRTLALIELALEGRLPRGLETTTIDGQTLVKMPLTMLADLRLKYQAEARAEADRARVAAGLPSKRISLARFTRVQ